MATMLEDFRHMDVRGADISKGEDCLYQNCHLHQVYRSSKSVGDKFKYALMISFNPIARTKYFFHSLKDTVEFGKTVKYYNQQWDSISNQEKRDIIAALRKMARAAKLSVLIVKFMSGLS